MSYVEMGSRIAARRKELDRTQEQLAAQLGVSAQAVSAWERGRAVPEAERLEALAEALHLSVSALVEGRVPMPRSGDAGRGDDTELLYARVEAFAREHGCAQTLAALPYALEKHRGQYRKGAGEVPYIIHPLDMAGHAIALGLWEDDLLATALLHDVCEDCGVPPEELPVGETVRKAVMRMSFTQTETESWDDAKARYYAGIRTNREASVVKLLDRCNNVSAMADAFSREKLVSYIEETRRYVLPLADRLRRQEPALSSALYLLEYHISSVIFTVEALMAR